jgi:hypothetical protein
MLGGITEIARAAIGPRDAPAAPDGRDAAAGGRNGEGPWNR